MKRKNELKIFIKTFIKYKKIEYHIGNAGIETRDTDIDRDTNEICKPTANPKHDALSTSLLRRVFIFPFRFFIETCE